MNKETEIKFKGEVKQHYKGKKYKKLELYIPFEIKDRLKELTKIHPFFNKHNKRWSIDANYDAVKLVESEFNNDQIFPDWLKRRLLKEDGNMNARSEIERAIDVIESNCKNYEEAKKALHYMNKKLKKRFDQ